MFSYLSLLCNDIVYVVVAYLVLLQFASLSNAFRLLLDSRVCILETLAGRQSFLLEGPQSWIFNPVSTICKLCGLEQVT